MPKLSFLKALETSVKSEFKRNFSVYMAPDAGFEPATNRLTADYSTAELIRNTLNKRSRIIYKSVLFVNKI